MKRGTTHDYAVASSVYTSQKRNDSTESAGEPAFTGRLEHHAQHQTLQIKGGR